jgi:hypothetical protein
MYIYAGSASFRFFVLSSDALGMPAVKVPGYCCVTREELWPVRCFYTKYDTPVNRLLTEVLEDLLLVPCGLRIEIRQLLSWAISRLKRNLSILVEFTYGEWTTICNAQDRRGSFIVIDLLMPISPVSSSFNFSFGFIRQASRLELLQAAVETVKLMNPKTSDSKPNNVFRNIDQLDRLKEDSCESKL